MSARRVRQLSRRFESNITLPCWCFSITPAAQTSLQGGKQRIDELKLFFLQSTGCDSVSQELTPSQLHANRGWHQSWRVLGRGCCHTILSHPGAPTPSHLSSAGGKINHKLPPPPDRNRSDPRLLSDRKHTLVRFACTNESSYSWWNSSLSQFACNKETQ